MNCEPKDLAVVIHIPEASPPSFAAELRRVVLGAVVRVVSVARHGRRGPIWNLESVIRIHWGGGWVDIDGIADCDLQPIRGTHAPAETTESLELVA